MFYYFNYAFYKSYGLQNSNILDWQYLFYVFNPETKLSNNLNEFILEYM